MMARKCDLCKEAAFIALPHWQPDRVPLGWKIVIMADDSSIRDAHKRNDLMLTVCPFCVAVAMALQAADQELASPTPSPSRETGRTRQATGSEAQTFAVGDRVQFWYGEARPAIPKHRFNPNNFYPMVPIHERACTECGGTESAPCHFGNGQLL